MTYKYGMIRAASSNFSQCMLEWLLSPGETEPRIEMQSIVPTLSIDYDRLSFQLTHPLTTKVNKAIRKKDSCYHHHFLVII